GNLPARLARDGHDVRGQRLAAVLHVRKVLEEPVVVLVGGQHGRDAPPGRDVAQGDGPRDQLLEAGVRIVAHVVADGAHAVDQRGAELDADAALAWARVGGTLGRLADGVVPPGEGRLVEAGEDRAPDQLAPPP